MVSLWATVLQLLDMSLVLHTGTKWRNWLTILCDTTAIYWCDCRTTDTSYKNTGILQYYNYKPF